VVEEGPAEKTLGQPLHPYTQALLAACYLGEARQSQRQLRGELSRLPAGYQGCRLVGRCPFALSGCREMQALVTIRPQHLVRCWRAEEIEKESGSVPRNTVPS
jgi:oligopeptide/dipeptide ABC transporter ATP-binding protein